MIDLVFNSRRPRQNGYYYVIWEDGDDPEFVWIDYFTVDGEEFWTWRWDPSDDPQDLFHDILNPENIQFSQIINLQ